MVTLGTWVRAETLAIFCFELLAPCKFFVWGLAGILDGNFDSAFE